MPDHRVNTGSVMPQKEIKIERKKSLFFSVDKHQSKGLNTLYDLSICLI